MGMTKAERQARQEEIDKNREANAAKRRDADHARFVHNHLPGTTLMFAAKRTRDRNGRRIEWHQQKLLMWSQDYAVTKQFVDDENRALGMGDRHPDYLPIQIERIFMMQIGSQWHRVYANRFIMGDLKMGELATRDQSGNVRYEVKKGDTLSQIVETWYGDAFIWQDLVAFNGITDPPHMLQIGQVLILPPVLRSRLRKVQPMTRIPMSYEEDVLACESLSEPPTLENGGIVCKGSLLLGTGCGKCSRCKGETESINATLDKHPEAK